MWLVFRAKRSNLGKVLAGFISKKDEIAQKVQVFDVYWAIIED